MSTTTINGEEYELHDLGGIKAPFDSITSAVTLIHRLDIACRSLTARLAKAENAVAQYRRTNGNLMVQIDRLNQRIAELEANR